MTRTKKAAALAAFVLLGALALQGCGDSYDSRDGSASGPGVTNPRDGWVAVDTVPIDGGQDILVLKRCDGTSMVYVSHGYRSGGVAAVPNAPECAP